ncbi:hypothetical protein GCM10018793_69430 [Streptomyces sulfonofaciens]|uniref:SnoaL-like domain-containing protein n=1 Tax=Streptomyces sulfonofaciens TaxID=68272 RepID=A0A919L982_9ACTN|nr:nuclear transport factor 2 family protein [Streptomyces sulfonofaciens]GHH88722.1 hypothetical protein GCM10018793_69430 [Streptomyces sulfonofaciens]
MRDTGHVEIERMRLQSLVVYERQARDLGLWTELAECYAPGATIRSNWFDRAAEEYVRLSRDMHDTTPSRHQLGQPVIDARDDRAVLEAPMTFEFRGHFRGTQIDLVSHTLTLHRAVRTGGRWRYLRTVAVFDRDTMTPAVPGDHVDLRPDDLSGARASYRMLTVWMTSRGYTVPGDRPGTDRPAEVAALRQEARAWAGLAASSVG